MVSFQRATFDIRDKIINNIAPGNRRKWVIKDQIRPREALAFLFSCSSLLPPKNTKKDPGQLLLFSSHGKAQEKLWTCRMFSKVIQNFKKFDILLEGGTRVKSFFFLF